jgi:hypothetical protein
MNKKLNSVIFVLLLISLLSFTNTKINQTVYSTSNGDKNSKKVTAGTELIKVDINVTAPTGPVLEGLTPIIVPLSEIADQLPSSVDPFGINASTEDDDVKWDAAYVTYEGNLIPSQVDDLDDIMGFSENDELVFTLPESVNLASGETASFSVYFSLKDMDLPPPYFPEVCTLSIYPDIAEINHEWPDMLGKRDGAYDIENGLLRATVLKAAAWSTGGVYHIQLLDEQGESRWDIVKQKFSYPSEIWKWSRFTLIDQFAAQNQFADRPYPGKVVKMITGPVRARITVQSTQPYVGGAWGGSTWTIDDLFGLFTYDIYANQTYLDYTLEMTGPKANEWPELVLELQNREWGGGRAGTLYKGIYVPGTGWVERSPDDTNIHKVEKSGFTDPWYLEALLEGTEVRPSQWHEVDEDPYRGYGFIFNNTGFSNISWDASSEELSSWYDAAQFPLRARYHPFDKIILNGQDKIQFMGDKYEEWTRSDPLVTIQSSMIDVTQIPFEFLFVNPPDVDFDLDNELVHIANITAFATDIKQFIKQNSLELESATFKILNQRDGSETGLGGDLTWNDSSETWYAYNFDVSSLDLYSIYVVVVYFDTSTLDGRSTSSERFGGGPDKNPPIIGAVNRDPLDIVKSTNNVTITADIIDYEGSISVAILSFSNGSWYNLTLNLAYGLYRATIPSHDGGMTIQYKIIAYDDASPPNVNTSVVYTYYITKEYVRGQSILPLAIVGGVLIVGVVLALRTRSLHRQKYDQVE